MFRSKSCTMPSLYEEEDDEGYFGDFNSEEYDDDDDDLDSFNPVTTPFISPNARRVTVTSTNNNNSQQQQFSVLAIVAAALRRSLVTCTVEHDDVASDVDIGCPTDVRHVSHVTFDRFAGFLGLPAELQADVTRKPPSASARVFGVSAQSMQCSYDERGNSVPTILLRMQNRLYSENGLLAEGIFRINPENSQEEQVRDQLNKGIVPSGIDVHCLSGLIKAWFRELPSGVLDCLSPEQVMHCNTEEECSQLVKLLPPTEAALLDWAINLMADVVEHEHHNKMNARNIAMVFAPNMTQMADPLTALIHAVQVMNFLKTLILKTLSQRQESAASTLFEECTGFVEQDINEMHTSNPTAVLHEQAIDDNSFQSCRSKSDDGEKWEPVMDKTNSPVFRKRRTLEHTFRDEYENMESDGLLNRLGLRKGMQKLRNHPVFQLSKTSKKSGGGLDGVVNTNY